MKTMIIEQKVTVFANQYRVFETSDDGEKGALVAFAHQKRLALKERIDFFTDESRSQLAFSVKAEKVMDIHGKFVVYDERDKIIGAVRKAFTSSLLRSTWEILNDKDQPEFIVRERSKKLAIFRRVWDFIPYIGDLPFFLKYHFDFVEPQSGEVVGKYDKTKLLYDHYQFDSVGEKLNVVDWRVVAVQCVLLDALQGR